MDPNPTGLGNGGNVETERKTGIKQRGLQVVVPLTEVGKR